MQDGIRDRITAIFELISRETDEFLIQKLEHELRHLDSRLVLKDGEYFSIDALVNQAKTERSKSRTKQGSASGQSVYEQMGYHRHAPKVNGLSHEPIVTSRY